MVHQCVGGIYKTHHSDNLETRQWLDKIIINDWITKLEVADK